MDVFGNGVFTHMLLHLVLVLVTIIVLANKVHLFLAGMVILRILGHVDMGESELFRLNDRLRQDLANELNVFFRSASCRQPVTTLNSSRSLTMILNVTGTLLLYRN